jgi:hypothetical protein
MAKSALHRGTLEELDPLAGGELDDGLLPGAGAT